MPTTAHNPPPTKKELSDLILAEPDPEWRRWFREVERRRKEAADPSRRPLRVSTIEKEGSEETICRQAAEPERVRAFLKKNVKKEGSILVSDFDLVRSAWGAVVGAEIKAETEVYSFKNGVLTIAVRSSSLLQEIRQFHKTAILRDLLDVWTASIPLLRIIYRAGEK